MTDIAVECSRLQRVTMAHGYCATCTSRKLAARAIKDVVGVDADHMGNVGTGRGRRVAMALGAAINRSIRLAPLHGLCYRPATFTVAVAVNTGTGNGIRTDGSVDHRGDIL